MRKSFYFVLSCSILLLSGMLSCTNSVRLRVMRPAVIDVPKDIQTLATANRYKPEKPNRVLNILEGLLSGEGIGTDRRGAEASLEGLAQVMRESPRFKTTQLAVELQGTGMANFPTPLAAEEVKRLCKLANADALVTIEAFDSDSKLTYGTKTKKEKVGDQTQDVVYHTVNAGIRVTVGWRQTTRAATHTWHWPNERGPFRTMPPRAVTRKRGRPSRSRPLRCSTECRPIPSQLPSGWDGGRLPN